ncbi:MAG: trypsin-like peptidase domain-containing protein [bacterium]
MKNLKLICMFAVLILFSLLSYVKAEGQATFRIITESGSGDYIGQNESWDFSNSNNYTITVTGANENSVAFNVKDFNVSNMTFEFASEAGKIISPGLYVPAKRFPFRDSYNGINISGDGRGCNEILGAFYVHEYAINNGTLEKAAIDFVQICEPSTSDLYSDTRPKLYGSLRYNSNVSNSCNNQGCAEAKKKLGFTESQESTNNQETNNTSNTNIVTSVSDLPKADAHKAIVKIKSYALNADNELSLFSSGSGVVINSSGIILTNRHVAILEDDFDNTERESSFIICLTEEINKDPECKYTGKLIASNKDLDVALLKIENIVGYGNKNSFSFLNLNTSDSTSINNEVTALGYPSIGGDTITITKGVISGKENKHDKNWLKTDAIISYGSSGGAAIDSSGGVIGITSAAHSDTLGSLGYIINVTSLNGWVNSNIGKTLQSNSLNAKSIELAKKILNIKNSNEFINSEPAYKITKPSDWDFANEDETELIIDKESDDESGYIAISAIKFPYNVDTGIVEASIKRELSFLLSLASIVKNEDIKINGNNAKKIIISAAGKQQNYYYIPTNNYLLTILYDYGQNDKDKTTIDNIINSLSLISSGQYFEKTEYTHDNPEFSIKLSNNWALLSRNSKEHPLFITNKTNKYAFADIEIAKTDDNTKNLNNNEYLSHIEQKVKEASSSGNIYDIKIEILKKDAHYKLSDNLTDVIMIDFVVKSISAGKILFQDRDYCIKTGEKYIVVSLNYFKDDANGYNDILNKFNSMLSSLTLGFSQSGSKASASQETNVKNITLYNSLKGKIMLKVEANGEAFYVHPTNKKMYYLGRPDDAFAVMREQGVGITNVNLSKIPVGFNNLTGPDSDGDGLPDLFEDAIGTNKNNSDSDKDGYNDKTELSGNYNPNGSGKLNLDNNFSGAQKGKIFLQVERNGEAWYINPADGKRYFLGRPTDAFQVMRNIGLGISNNDFGKL